MNKDVALTIAAIVFALSALGHLLRLLFNFNLIVARQLIPIWVSLPGFIIAFSLCILMLMAKKSKPRTRKS